MSLKTDYFDGATGLQTKMNDGFDGGVVYVSNNATTLSNGLKDNAAKGNTNFIIQVSGTGTVNSSYLRANNGNNLLLKAFLAGIQHGLSLQDIYDYECTPALNVSDSINTNVDFKFTFATT